MPALSQCSVILRSWEVLLSLPKRPLIGPKPTFEEWLIQHRSCNAFHLEFSILGSVLEDQLFPNQLTEEKDSRGGQVRGRWRETSFVSCLFFLLSGHKYHQAGCILQLAHSEIPHRPPKFLTALSCISRHKTQLKFRMVHHLLNRKCSQSQ